MKVRGGKLQARGGKLLGAGCPCCPSGCGASIVITADLVWAAAGDLDLYGALAPALLHGLHPNPGDRYWDNATASFKYYPDPDFGSYPDHDLNQVSHWSILPNCVPPNDLAHAHGITVTGAITGCEDGGDLHGGPGTNPKNEHWTTSTGIVPGDLKKIYGWYRQYTSGDPAITPTVATLTILNVDFGPFGGASCKIVVNGTDEVLPGDTWSTSLLTAGFGDKGDGAFDYLTGHVFHNVRIVTVENGGPV